MIPASLLLLPAFLATDTEDWPGWRGPGGNGIAPGSPPVEWSEEKNVRWKVSIPGKGKSSPVVWGNRVFVTTAVSTGKQAEVPAQEATADQDPPARPPGRGGRGGRPGGGRGGFGGRSAPPEEQEFFVLALDRADGSVVWQKKARTGMPPQGTHNDGSYATPTCVTDGEHLIASFGSNGLYAYTMDGELVWEKDLGDMEIMLSFGEGSSPVLHGDKLIVIWDHNGDSFIVALDKGTGEEKWRASRGGGTSWTTPIVVQAEGGAQVIVGTEKTTAYDLETGEELWTYGQVATGRGGGVISSPVEYEGLVFLSSGSRGGELRAIYIPSPEEELEPGDNLLWAFPGDTPYVPSLIACDGIVYMLKSNSGLLSAFDAGIGERLYGPQRMEGVANAYASPVAADGRLYFADRDGAVEVIAAGPEYRSLAVNVLDEGFDASPAIAGDEIFLRGRSHVYCIAEE